MHTAWIVGGVMAATAAALAAVIIRTRWLQSRTLEKCVALSVLLHAVLAALCALVGGMAPASWGTEDEGRMTMVVVLADDDPAADPVAVDDADAASEMPSPEPTPAAMSATPEPAANTAGPPRPPADLVPLLEVAEPAAAAVAAATTDADEAGPSTEASATPGDEPPEPVDTAAAPAPPHTVPNLYADRVDGRRAAAAAARGGSVATERAVQAALVWLAGAQSSDGRWDADRHGAGIGRSASAQHDSTIGSRSDTGVTGLSLLAFLGAGTTHQQGPHAATVARGLRFLLDSQRSDGSFAGEAKFFAALYCHGMATLAVAECCALSGDPALRSPLERAVGYTLAMQHPVTGGWRYARGDRGDTSQLGWQVMALASAEQAGLGDFDAAEARARHFLQSVSSGTAGGRAAYRSGERPTMAMTAEALVCRLFLGMPTDHPAAVEALDVIGRQPPERRWPNAYSWYYATVASFHCGGPQWEVWNQRLQAALLPLQRSGAGPLDGSWDPDPAWGVHGGRVYATALSALTLEVYYRHLPLFQRGGRIAVSPR